MAVRWASRSGASSGAAASNGLIETNAVSGSPAASALISAAYPLISPRSSRRRTRCWAAETDRPVCRASSVKLIRPSRASNETILRLVSSTWQKVACALGWHWRPTSQDNGLVSALTPG